MLKNDKLSEQDEPKRPKKKKNNNKKLKLSHFIILLFLLLVVAGISTVGTVILAAMSGMPSIENNDITDYNVTTYIVDKDGAFVDKLSANTNYIAAQYSDISTNMMQAVVSIEDKRFYDHHGIDPIRITGAMMANLRAGGTVQGGSTITQQVAGLSMLDRSEKTYKRKIQEAILAVRIEGVYSKEEILTAYLNRCYFGIGLSGMSCYGIEAAANDILGKHAYDLTIADSALLAGMIQNPTYWSPITDPENAKVRREQVLNAMLSNGVITQEEFEEANNSEIYTASITEADTNVKQTYNQSYIDYVIEEALQVLGLERDPNQLYTGGYVIETSLNQDLQSYMYDYFNNDYYFPAGYSDDIVQGAMVVLNTEDSSIAGMIGGRHLDENQERGLNRATQSTRQPGSTFKPIFVYGPAFEQGKGTGSAYLDAEYTAPYSGSVIRNADLQYRGTVTIRYALEQSLNTVASRVLEEIGPETGMEFAKGLGITTLVEESDDGVTDLTISAGLGGLTHGVTVLEMAGAYGAFANKGIYTKPHAITRITTDEGEVVWEEKPESHRAMEETTAYMITSCLQSVITNGIGSAGAITDGRVTAGKTGTTDNTKDLYFCGYTPQYVAAVWMGYDTPTAMYGTSSIPAYAFSNIMSYLHSGLEYMDFERPDGLTDVLVDSKSGLLATQSTPYTYRSYELFKEGTEPTTYSSNTYASYYAAQQQATQQQTTDNSTQTDSTTTDSTTTYDTGQTEQYDTGGGGYNTSPVQ